MIAYLRGSVLILLMSLSTIAWCIPLYVIAFVRFVGPGRIRTWCTRRAMNIAECWIGCNGFLLERFGVLRLRVTTQSGLSSLSELSYHKWYLVLCNHQSWTDILILQYVFNYRVPMLKFFIKQSLVFVPVLGIAWWVLDFPILKRYSRTYLLKHPEKRGKDLETTRRSCKQFQLAPVSVLNFLEGTRFTEAKRQAQTSPFRWLLRPKIGGAALAVSSLYEQLDSVLDVTIRYTDIDEGDDEPRSKSAAVAPSMFEFLCGKAGAVEVLVQQRLLPPTLSFDRYETDSTAKRAIHAWVYDLWREKDQILQEAEPVKVCSQVRSTSD